MYLSTICVTLEWKIAFLISFTLRGSAPLFNLAKISYLVSAGELEVIT